MRYIILFLVITAIVGLFIPIVVVTERGYCNIYTGSIRNYREYLGGYKSKEIHFVSEFEKRLRRMGDVDIREKWVSFNGTGRTIFGVAIRYGHGNPGPILDINSYYFVNWIKSKSDADLRLLYDLLINGSREEIKKEFDSINDEILEM